MAKVPRKRGEAEHGKRLPHRRGKKLKGAREKVDRLKRYMLDEALELLKSPEMNFARFDQSVDLAVNLGVDPRKSDQVVRGAVVLPHGTGKQVRVVAFTKGEKVAEAEEAGADFVGGEELVEKIKSEGWMDFDKAVATPDMMRFVGKIGRILAPRGLMPSPKTGTVTFDVGNAVKELKAGKVDFRVEKAGIIHVPVGRISFDADKLKGNILAIIDTLMKMKPATAKGVYIKGITLSSTQSPGIRIDTSEVVSLTK